MDAETPIADDDAVTPAAEDVEQGASDASGEPVEPRRRGRPKGTPKTGGRPAKPRTPQELRSYIAGELGKLDRLLAIARGDELRTSGPTGKSMLAHPTFNEQLRAWELLLKKVMPDLQSTTLDANLTGTIEAPIATRDLARSILGILSTAQLEKVPHRGEFTEAEEVAEDEEGNAAAEPSGGATGEEDAPASPEGGAASGQPASPLPDPDAIKARLRELNVPFNDGPTHVPHNPDATAAEMPPAMSAEDRARENLRRRPDGTKSPYGDAWADELKDIPEGPHQQKPNAARPDFEPSGLPKKHYVGDRGHYYEHSLVNGDGRIRYTCYDAHGMRFAFAWGREEATEKINQLIEKGR